MKKRLVSLLVVLAMTLSFVPIIAGAAASIEIGEYLQMGTYYGEPILWRCVDIDENGPLMLSDKIICIKSFDAPGDNTSGSHGRGYDDGYYRKKYGSNYWADSNMRCWLNSTASAGNVEWTCGNPPTEDKVWGRYNEYADEAGFLTNFSQGERNAVKTVTQKSLLDGYEHDSNNRNENCHRYNYNIYNVVQNYDSAYSENVTDKMFLLDVKQVNTVYNNGSILGSDYYIGEPTAQAVENSEYKDSDLQSGNKWDYWLRSPDSYYYSYTVRVVSSGGFVYNDSAYSSYVGVRPAFYLNLSSARFTSGSGTLAAPYTVEGSGTSEPSVTDKPVPEITIQPEPETTRTLDLTFSGGNDIVYNADDGTYDQSSFLLTGTVENLYTIIDLDGGDYNTVNANIEITLPDGYSFEKDTNVRTKTYTFNGLIYDYISEIIYLQNPPVGSSVMTAHITGDNVEESDVKYDFIVDKYEFNADIYRANYLLNSDFGKTMEDTYINMSTPCKELEAAGAENGLGTATTAWSIFMDTLNTIDKPSSIADYAFEEKDMYSAIIMSMFESSVDYKVVEVINNNITKQTTSLLSFVTSEMKNVYNYDILNDDNFDYTKMSDEQLAHLEKAIGKYFKKEHPNAQKVSDILKYFGYAVKGATNIQTLIENIVQYNNIRMLSDSMKQVMRDMYNKCPADNLALKEALRECMLVMDSGTAAFAAEMAAYSTAAIGTDVAQFGIDKLWGSVKNSFNVTHPDAYIILIAYTSGKYITQVCFNADSIQEKYCKVIAMNNTEELLKSVYNDIKNDFKTAQTEETAKKYNSAVDIMFNMLDADCSYALSFANSVDSALFGKLAAALGDKTIEDFNKQVKSIQTSCDQFHEQVLTFWLFELEKDDINKFNQYSYLLDESTERMRKKYNVNCPVDVYVFDKNGVIVGSVVDNVPYCRSGANITIAVDGDKKTIYTYGDNEYDIVYEGNGTGTMDITVTEYDNENNSVRNVYFNNLELTDGLKYTSTENGTVSEDNAYILTTESEESIMPDYDSQADSETETYTASITRGYFTGAVSVSQELHKGENAEITVYVPEGYKFVGWTSDAGKNIFADANARRTTICMPEYNVNITAELVELPQLSITDVTDSSVTVKALNCENIESGIIILALYDNNGAMKSLSTKNYAEEVIFNNLDLNNMTVKAMLWDSINTMKPLALGTAYDSITNPSGEVIPATAKPEATSSPELGNTWTCSSDDATKKNGDYIMNGMTLLFDVSYAGNTKEIIDGNQFTNRISGGENGKWSSGAAVGTALKYIAPEDGVLKIYVVSINPNRVLYITKKGVSDNKMNVDGEAAYFKNETDAKISTSLSLSVKKGETYYAYIEGSKACFVGAELITSGGEEKIIYGDVDGDGDVDQDDVTLLRKYAVGEVELDERAFKAADVNANGSADIGDIMAIRRYILGSVPALGPDADMS